MTTSIIGIMLGGRKNSRQHDWENMTFVPQDDKGLMMNFLYDEAPKGHVGGAQSRTLHLLPLQLLLPLTATMGCSPNLPLPINMRACFQILFI